jgi:hypothetical protein
MSGHHNEILGRVWTKSIHSPNSELVRQVRLLPMVLSPGKIRSGGRLRSAPSPSS